MRLFLILVAMVVLALAAWGWWKYSSLFPRPSQEIVQLDNHKRQTLIVIRDEKKFEPHSYLPQGYTGIATPEEGVIARAAVNDVIAAILSRKDGPVPAIEVSSLIGRNMKRVRLLETEDRARTADYMIEIWYLLGFRGATGHFAYGSAFRTPEGYSEPLPPGWKSPTEPRPIGQP